MKEELDIDCEIYGLEQQIEELQAERSKLSSEYPYRVNCDNQNCGESERIKSTDESDMPEGWIVTGKKLHKGKRKHRGLKYQYCPKCARKNPSK